MALGRNVRLVRELRGFTQKELSDRTEGIVSQAALSALENRDSKRSVFLKELAKALCVPTATLLKANLDPAELEGQPIVAWEDSTPEEEGFVDIPEYELCLSAGGGFANSPESCFKVHTGAPSVRYRLDFFAGRGIAPEHCKRFRVSGESMEPLLYDGDRILVDTAPQERIKDGAVYAVNYDGELRVKRLQKRLDGTLTLISDNPNYPPEIVPPDILQDGRFFIIGKVIEKSSTAGFD
jgi:hypothetical protein